MEKEVVDGRENTNAAACKKKRASLHRSFQHLSRALKKLHARRHGHQASASVGGGDPPTPSSSAAASFLSGCMHNPRTQSFATARRHRHNHDDEADALAVNFRSLRIGTTEFAAAVAGDGGSSSSPPPDRYSSDDERDDGAVPAPPTPALDNNKAVVGGAGVAVVTFSAAPYEDFRRSMREMVDASAAGRGSAAAAVAPAVDWDFMEELLFCYLHLNDRAVHGDILRAFTDTVAALRRRRRRRRAAAAKSRRARRRRWSAGADINGDGGAAQAVAPA
ncbi:unnamed protein product [Urochloa decumbens]|uniref:Transcription repressor n=1 Tax=Urochloa decumbens TaxID=240449 RepID=A0ABC9FRV8_9POAL